MDTQLKPISLQEVMNHKLIKLPPTLIQVVNELIEENFNVLSSYVLEEEILKNFNELNKELLKKFVVIEKQKLPDNYQDLIIMHYRKAGWKVEYLNDETLYYDKNIKASHYFKFTYNSFNSAE